MNDRTANEPVNPYEMWLGISQPEPNYYQLLGLREGESSSDAIRAAADRAITRVRSHRPGKHASQWAQLLDLLQRVKAELMDPQAKQAYDSRLPGARRAAKSGPASPALVAQPRAASTAEISTTTGATHSSQPLDPMAPIDPSEFAPSPATEPLATMPATAMPGAETVQAASDSPAPVVRAAKRRENRSSTPLLLVAGMCLGVLLTVVGVLFRDKMFPPKTDLASNNSNPTPTSANHSGSNGSSSYSQPTPQATSTDPSATTGDNDSDGSMAEADEPMNVEDSTSSTMPDVAEAADPTGTVPDPTMMEAEPEPQPDPTDEPEPGDGQPESQPGDGQAAMPTAEELKKLLESLTAARTAITAHDFAAAAEQIDQAKSLAKTPEQQAMVGRLEAAAGYMQKFRESVDRAVRSLDAGVSFQVSEDVIVGVVERRADAIVVKVAGRNQTYPLNQLPLKLGLALADQGLGLEGAEEAPLIRGVFQALHPRATAEHIAEVRKWWEEAGEPGAALIPLLDDQYGGDGGESDGDE